MIAGLLEGQRADGSFGVHPYTKWTGAHWRLVSLAELGVPGRSRAARAAANTVLDWIAAPSEPVVVAGKERRHASMEGNALAVCCHLGMAHSLRVRRLVEVLLRSQWPDGGWNCDPNPDAHHSSFHETLAPIWGLAEYHRNTGEGRARRAARRAAELLLQRRRDDGTWRAGGQRYWRLRGESNLEVVDWGDAHEVVTAAALAMLQ